MQLQLEMERAFGKLSDEQFYQFCLANKGRLRVERDQDGQIIIMPPTGLETGNHNSELNTEFSMWNRKTRLGKVFDSNAGFTLPDTSVKAPDVSWVRMDRWLALPDDERKRFARLAPDFVLELRSETDEPWELRRKMEQWMQNGVRLGWLIDTQNAATHVYRPGHEPETIPFGDTLSGQDVLPGFSLNLETFFENLV